MQHVASMYVYILQSKTTSRYYAGSTQDVSNRLNEHNSGECKWTRHGVPWDLVYLAEFPSRSEAVKEERRIKSRGIGRYLQEMLTKRLPGQMPIYPDIEQGVGARIPGRQKSSS